MNDELAAAEGAKKFAAQFPGFLKACEMLGEVGSVKQAGDEAQARLDKLKVAEAELTAKIEADKAAFADHQKAIATEIDASKDAAASHIANQTAEAQKIVTDAKEQAAIVIRDAQAEASKIVDDANQATATIKNRIGELTNAINDKKLALEAVEGDIIKRQAALDDINGQIAALKAKL